MLDISPLINMEWLKIFSHSVGCHFVWLTIPFPYRSFSVSWVTFLVDLSACAIGVLFRNLSSVAMDSRLFLLLLSGSVLSGFMLRFLLHFVLSFVQGDRYGSIWILHADIQLDHHHLLKMVFFFFLFSILYFWCLSNKTCLFLSVPGGFYYYSSLCSTWNLGWCYLCKFFFSPYSIGLF